MLKSLPVDGMALALGASFAFSLMNALAKGCDLPPGEIAFFRGFVGLIVTILIMRKQGISFRGARPRVLVLRGLLGGFSLLLNFTALSGLPLADATFLSHSSSLFVVIFAHFLLQEKLPGAFYALFGLALGGVVLVVKPGGDWLHSHYALAGLCSALTAAGASLSIRNLSKDHSTYLIMLYFMGAAALVPLPFSLQNFQWPSALDWCKLIALSAVSYVGQYLLTRAYSFKEAAVVAMTRFAGVAFNVGLGFLIWSEIPDRYSALGGALILSACLALYAQELRAARLSPVSATR